jgi:hypothetical protein
MGKASIVERRSRRDETQADNVASGSQEDRGVSARKVGEGEAAEKSGVVSRCHYGKRRLRVLNWLHEYFPGPT